jgi:hypothetical protein
MFILNYFNRFNKKFLSEETKSRSERIILKIAIASFALHLAIIFLVDFGIIKVDSSDLLSNPIVAIYTPFSFILLYEVYLLIYYLPKSFTTYISKQYEIITLIVIRRLFKDLSNLKLTTDWFSNKQDLQFTYDLATSILLFFLIYLFYVQSKIRFAPAKQDKNHAAAISSFIKIKNQIATFLVPVFLILAIYSLSNWLLNIFLPKEDLINSFSNINNIFFEQFFTILIVADVLLLLFSFFITDEFHKVIRNSGFIISTILIRISFSISGGLNNLLIISGITFGLLILIIHNKFERKISNESLKQ